MAEIEADYRQPPGWWGTLSQDQRVRLLALWRLQMEDGHDASR